MVFVSPTSHNDPNNQWSNEENAYDGNTATFATCNFDNNELELILDSISCDKIWYYFTSQTGTWNVIISVFYDGSYHEIFNAQAVEGSWQEVEIGSTEEVTKAKIIGFTGPGNRAQYIHEFEFNDLTPPPPTPPTDGGGSRIQHDFEKFPELTNRQMQEFQFSSPHKQITEDFYAMVVKVHDGDTITVRTEFRDFDFPIRLLDIDAPELNEGGEEAREWLKARILEQSVQILMDPNRRVEKYGRLLGKVFYGGLDMGQSMLHFGLVAPFERRFEGQLPNMDKELRIEKWL